MILYWYKKIYFKRTVCIRAISLPLINSQELPSDAYKGIDKDYDIEDGNCLVKEAFTPDGENCYLCNNKKVGCQDVKDLAHIH